MGKRTVYYQSKISKGLKEHLIDDFKLFRNWILTEHFKSIKEYGERLISQRLEEFLKENQSIEELNYFHQEIIDELTLEYFHTFCDYGEGKGRFEIVGPMMGTWRYNSS